MTPLYNQRIVLPAANITGGLTSKTRLSMVGGPSSDKDDNAKGYVLPPSYGLLHFYSPRNLPDILQCTATVSAYQDHPVEVIALPGEVLIDVPCSVEIEGPVGTEILLQVWPMFATPSRGGKRSYFKANGAGTLAGVIPLWANSFDFGGGANVLFYRDSTLATPTGFLVGAAPIVGMSVPSGSGWFVTTSVTPELSIIFRQQ